MNKLVILILVLSLFNNCSFNKNPNIFNAEENNIEDQKNIKKIFIVDKKIVQEYNQKIKIDLSKILISNFITDNKNNYGSQNYDGKLIKIGNYKFSKLKNIEYLNFKPIFLDDGIIFFDKKGSIIRYDINQKVLWKKNFYSKVEKKLNPKLSFFIEKENLFIADNIAKFYSINIITGELNWLKNNMYPFNSDIKNFNTKIFLVDSKNILRCYNKIDGSECWSVQTEDSFTISNSRFSLVVDNNAVIFNNSIGDITSVDIETGLILWQLPTQKKSIINETYNFKISKLVADSNSIFFSNNKNEFFSIDLKTGTINWINKVNSNLTPILVGDLIFTISNEGFLFVLDKNDGNILRITDLYKNYKIKKRKNIEPIGFTIGNTNLYLTSSDGKMIVVDLNIGNIVKIEKVSGSFASKPFIFNQNLYVVRNGSIVQYN